MEIQYFMILFDINFLQEIYKIDDGKKRSTKQINIQLMIKCVKTNLIY